MADTSSSVVRSPLAEATNRINAFVPTHDQQQQHHKLRNQRTVASVPAPEPKKQHVQALQDVATSRVTSAPAATVSPNNQASVAQPTVQNQSQAQNQPEYKRDSQTSYASTTSSQSKKNYKTHVGPWQLGKTLGKGSSARVRLCRHINTGQLAAVKIVNRRMAYLVQDSSLAALSKWDKSLPDQINGEIRVPVAIEREVAILKLIEHPNIMKLYDIWESRSEIYLILEYIDQGDLFTFINSRGRLTEEVSLYFFRQIISAMTYCHSFNICHRDLKPENILITADFRIKIADFGMAALHQTDTHQLATACGSPHYAAPELLKNKQYRGDKADIWSMGVILYAMLSAALPFDDPDLRMMMAKTKKGEYEMPKFLSPEAEDLIRRMLQVNPDRRVSLKQIWAHPLVQKYAYLDELGDNSGQPPDTRKGFQYTPVPRQQIDTQLLRQLRSMWHMFSESDLALKLSCDEPNDQKAFYWLLYNYREKQLEDFKPELAHSMSDYHHLKPGVWKRRVSTCQFSQPGPNGKVRSVSRFTVISRTAETDAGTVQSYDPYRDSRMLRPAVSQSVPTKVTIHQGKEASSEASQVKTARNGSQKSRGRPPSRGNNASIRPRSSRGSMTSLQSSHHGTPRAQGRGLRHKRGVDFSHIKKRSNSSRQMNHHASRRHAGTSDAYPVVNQVQPSGDGTSREVSPVAAEPVHQLKKNASVLFHEELRNLSSNVAKSCDEAFKNTLIEDDSIAGSLINGISKRPEGGPLSSNPPDGSPHRYPAVSPNGYETRPLPPVPAQGSSKSTLTTTIITDAPVRTAAHTKGHTESAGTVAKTSSKVSSQTDRRTVSVPVYHNGTKIPNSTLPAINEDGRLSMVSHDKTRTVSAPPHTPSRMGNRKQYVGYSKNAENTIRIVHSPTALSPVKMPKPLNVQKKRTVTGVSGRSTQTEPLVTEKDAAAAHDRGRTPSQSSYETIKKKKSSWFKRLSKSDADSGAVPTESIDGTVVAGDITYHHQLPESNSSDAANKKRGFNFAFWKTTKAKELNMSIDDEPEPGLPYDHATRGARSSWRDSGSNGIRTIDVKQNWLARLFRVKPATSYLCMVITRKRARQEIAILFREWRKYGIRGVQVDKNRNIVFAQVGAQNFLDLKEVEFAAEIMTVIEHGKKQPLCIVRLTQERGAASSFHKVVETMRAVFESRHLLVMDKERQRMMIKTLNSSFPANDNGTKSNN